MKLETLELPPPRDHLPCQSVTQSDDVSGLGEYPVCYCKDSLSFFFGFLVMCTGHTSGPLTNFVDLYVIRRLFMQGYAFWGLH